MTFISNLVTPQHRRRILLQPPNRRQSWRACDANDTTWVGLSRVVGSVLVAMGCMML